MEVNMNEDANTLILRECYEKFVAGDIPEMLEHFSEDIVFIVPEVENAPYGGIWHGKKAVAEFFTVLAEAEDINDFEAREYIADGDRVVVLGRSISTVRSTGRHYSTEWVHIHTLKEGKVTSFTQYFDTAAALRAFQKVTTALK